jgi:hypothetical protein
MKDEFNYICTVFYPIVEQYMNNMNDKILSKEKRREILTELVTSMGAQVIDDYIIVKKGGLIFKLFIWGNIVKVGYLDCQGCDLDCYKQIEFDIEADGDLWNDIEGLNREDISRLGKIKTLIDQTDEFDIQEIKELLKEQLQRIKFILLGFNTEKILDFFKNAPGSSNSIPFLKNSKCKTIDTFPQLVIDLCFLSETIIKNFISDRPAPVLIDFLKDVYGFIIISDSTSEDTTRIKTKFLSPIYKYNPLALILVLGLNYGEKNHLDPSLMEKILNKKVYGIPNQDQLQSFMEILYQSVLLRIDQMKDADCSVIER